MDLRKQKTQTAIQEAFLQLRREKNLEQISVTELSSVAQISKATFYLHYRDVFDLSEKLQKAAIQKVLEQTDISVSLLDHWSEFTKSMLLAVERNNSLLSVLFSGSQMAMCPILLEDYLRESILAGAPELKENMELSVRLTYHIQGGYHAYLRHAQHADIPHIMEIIADIHRKSGPQTI